MCEQRADWSHNRRDRIFNRRSTSGAQGRKVRWKKIWDGANNAKLKVLVDDLEAPNHRLILLSKNRGSWLTVRGTTVNGTVLVAK